MNIRWFVERRAEEGGEWAFLDGAVPIARERRSALVYSGYNAETYALLGADVGPGSALARGLPVDLSPIPRACALVCSPVGERHSWRTVDELSALTTPDREFLAVMERLVAVEAGRVVYWFEAKNYLL